VKNWTKFIRDFCQMLLKKYKTRVKFQFGIREPRNLNEAYKLDDMNGKSIWLDAVAKEVKLPYHDYECFKLIPKN
jgi:hypothetical protein